jgi:hypothetical protein
MKWIMLRSLPYTHEFQLEGDDRVELKLSCRESEIISKMQSVFGSDVEVDLFGEEGYNQ